MLLIINHWIHHKNKVGLEAICKYLNLPYTYGSINDLELDVDKRYQFVYDAANAIDTDKYDNRDGRRKWLFGPHFSVFPDSKLDLINKAQHNIFYIMPSQWCIDIWKNIFNVKINMFSMPFPVDTVRFNEVYNINSQQRNSVLIYYKRRDPKELGYLLEFMNNKGESIKMFSYTNGYDENDFINWMHISKYAIILDAGESQGFAIEEMMACNIPLLVWNINDLSQEYGENTYPAYKTTTIPYWDNRCGEVFCNKDELATTYQLFIKRIADGGIYRPRDYILDNLTVDKCATRFCHLLTNSI